MEGVRDDPTAAASVGWTAVVALMERSRLRIGNAGFARAPMSWDRTSGFSSAAPYRPYATNRAAFNVAAETGDPGSLLGWYQQLIQLRTQYPVLQRGLPEAIDGGASNGAPFVYTRVLGSDRIWLVYNPGKVTASVISRMDATVEAIFNPSNVKVDRLGARLTFSEIPPRGVAVWKQLN